MTQALVYVKHQMPWKIIIRLSAPKQEHVIGLQK